MEPLSYWAKFIGLIKSSYTSRVKENFGGICMGFIGGQHLLFAGKLASLVGPFWWVAKGVGTVVLAFFSGLATSYAGYLIECYKEKKSLSQKEKNTKRKRA